MLRHSFMWSDARAALSGACLMVAASACAPTADNTSERASTTSTSGESVTIERATDVIVEMGTPLQRLTVTHTPPKKAGQTSPTTTWTYDAHRGELTASQNGKQTSMASVLIGERDVRLQRDGKVVFSVKRQPTGYLIYDDKGSFVVAGRRTNVGWDLMGRPDAMGKAERYARHKGALLETPTGTGSAVERNGQLHVGGPGTGRLRVSGLSIEAAALLAWTARPLDERLVLAVFVHTLGKEHRDAHPR